MIDEASTLAVVGAVRETGDGAASSPWWDLGGEQLCVDLGHS